MQDWGLNFNTQPPLFTFTKLMSDYAVPNSFTEKILSIIENKFGIITSSYKKSSVVIKLSYWYRRKKVIFVSYSNRMATSHHIAVVLLFGVRENSKIKLKDRNRINTGITDFLVLLFLSCLNFIEILSKINIHMI